jgi:hypothetical protein
LGQSSFAQKADPAKKKSTHELFIVHQAGIVTLVTMALSLLSMHRHLCLCCDGNIASLMCRHLCHCQVSVLALIACCQAGVVALVVMALLLSLHRRLCHSHDSNCCSCHNGVVAIVDAQAFLLLLS